MPSPPNDLHALSSIRGNITEEFTRMDRRFEKTEAVYAGQITGTTPPRPTVFEKVRMAMESVTHARKRLSELQARLVGERDPHVTGADAPEGVGPHHSGMLGEAWLMADQISRTAEEMQSIMADIERAL